MKTTANERFYDALSSDEAVMVDNALFPVEQCLLSSLNHLIRDKVILEIGVGSGRVTPHLRSLTRHYVGIDRSPTMINMARSSNPDTTLFVCDALDMSMFESGAFDAIFFFWNGIDEVTHSGRVHILNEVERLLQPGGMFVFSAHNLTWNGIPHYALPRMSPSSTLRAWIWDNSLRMASYVYTLVAFVAAVITAKGHILLWEYENMPPPMLVPRMYIKPESQVRQLHLSGFREIDVLAIDGTGLAEHNRDKDYFVYYLARK